MARKRTLPDPPTPSVHPPELPIQLSRIDRDVPDTIDDWSEFDAINNASPDHLEEVSRTLDNAAMTATHLTIGGSKVCRKLAGWFSLLAQMRREAEKVEAPVPPEPTDETDKTDKTPDPEEIDDVTTTPDA